MPWLNGKSEVEISNGKFEEAVGHDVEDFAKIPELWYVSQSFLDTGLVLTSSAVLASLSLRSQRCLPVPWMAATIWQGRYIVKTNYEVCSTRSTSDALE